MRPDPHDSWGVAILSDLSIFEKEVHTVRWPAGGTLRLSQGALSATLVLKVSQDDMEPMQVGATVGQRRCVEACL